MNFEQDVVCGLCIIDGSNGDSSMHVKLFFSCGRSIECRIRTVVPSVKLAIYNNSRVK